MMDMNDESSAVSKSSAAGKAPEREAEADTKPENSNNFQFLTFTDFQQTVDPRTKRKVRSHVMHRVHRTMRSGERAEKEGVIVLDTSSLFEVPAPQQGQALAALPEPSTLGAGRSNPFANYPIQMSQRTQYLFDHCKYPSTSPYTGSSGNLLIIVQCAETFVLCSGR